MIKISKDLSDVPESLNSKITCQRRNDVIEKRKYPDSKSKYDNRYKMNDIKEKLEKIYHNKCAYCEKDVGDSFYHIEHYRPKSEYYWLVYSWDNLMLCCDKCNIYKNTKFETEGIKASFDINDLENIQSLTLKYNELEKPKLIHPESEDVEEKLRFGEEGSVDSEDERVKYTIQTCQIDRRSANERRKKIFDDFLEKFRSKVREYQITKNEESLGKIKGLIEDFISDAQNPRKEYLAFRQWLIRHTKYFGSDSSLLKKM